MLDIRLIREDPETVRKALANRQEDTAIVDEIVALDTTRRERILALEELRHSRKQLARDRAAAEQGRALREQVRSLEDTVRDLEQDLEGLLLQVPNVPHPSVPIGAGDDDNPVVRTWGEPRTFDFTPAPHWTLGESLGIIDFERGVKLSGSRFYVLKGLGARLQRALIAFMVDLHTNEHGYQEIYPPWMVKRESAAASGHLPKFADTMYHDEEDDLWFVPTAEVPLTNLHRDEIIAPGMLPFDYVAYTACFRREKMSAGKDTRGIKRGHQFDKVEMYKFTEPESSYAQLEKMIDDAEEVCRRL
ncbi:MAG: serine--tRNA ligase, partial [Dehalococcoidales bacterium]